MENDNLTRPRWGFIAAFAVGLTALALAATMLQPATHVTPQINRQAGSSLESRGRDLYEPTLSSILQRTEGCHVTRTFYNGWRSDDQQFFWSVECRGGQNYLVTVKGKTGDVQTLGCDVAARLKIMCFEKW